MKRYLAMRDFSWSDRPNEVMVTQTVLVMKAGEEVELPDHVAAAVAKALPGALMEMDPRTEKNAGLS